MASGEIKGKYAHYRFGYESGRFSILAGTEKLKDLSMVSQRDPVREAERHLGSFRLKPGMLAVVAGAAHLPLLELLVEQTKSKEGFGGWILLFEADTELYLALKKYRPEIFEHIAAIVPENVGVLSELVEKIDVEHFAGYRIFENKPSLGIAPTFYAHAVADFKRRLASRFSDLFTRLEFEERWVFNALSKLSLMHSMRPVSSLFGLGKGAKALLVSTGPSLHRSLAAIQKNREKYFIACADSAYRVLVRSGITPHLVFSLDSQAHTTKHFALLPQGTKGSYPILVCDAVSNPIAAREWKGESCLSFTAQFIRADFEKQKDERRVSPGCDYLEEENFFEHTAGLIPGDLQSGGSVATSIFDLLRLMDFDSIVFVGQDLAYTYREIHTPGTHHTDEWLSKTTNRLQPLENINERVLRRRHTKREVSLSGRTIVTDYVLSLYRDWFSNAVGAVEKKVLNATCEGLVIEGAPPLQNLDTEEQGINAEILARFLDKDLIRVNSQRIAALRAKILSATDSLDEGTLPFLRYVGRKFAIKAMRVGDTSSPLYEKQKTKQRHFLRKLISKLYLDA